MTEEFPTKPDECPDHHAHYRREARPVNNGVYGDYPFQCLNCGFTWTRPGASLEVEIKAKVEIEAKVDVIAYFTALSERGRKEYEAVDLDAQGYVEEWERPLAYLTSNLDIESGDLGGINVLPEYVTGAAGDVRPVSERVDFYDEVEADVRIRDNRFAYSYDWTEEDFGTLRAAVSWIDTLHVAIEAEEEGEDGEEARERLARLPGPLDTPLFEQMLSKAPDPSDVLGPLDIEKMRREGE